jgi:hypothetical protein
VEDISPYGYGLAWDDYPWPEGMAARLEDRISVGPPTLG